jgi:hypothetical protein
MMTAPATPVRPEPVEGQFFLLQAVKKEERGFDTLSPNGVGL